MPLRALVTIAALADLLKGRRVSSSALDAAGQGSLFGPAPGAPARAQLVPKLVTVAAHVRADGTHVQQHQTTVYVHPDEAAAHPDAPVQTPEPEPIPEPEPEPAPPPKTPVELFEEVAQEAAQLAAGMSDVYDPDPMSHDWMIATAREQVADFWTDRKWEDGKPSPHVEDLDWLISGAMSDMFRQQANGYDLMQRERGSAAGAPAYRTGKDTLLKVLREVSGEDWYGNFPTMEDWANAPARREDAIRSIMEADSWDEAFATLKRKFPRADLKPIRTEHRLACRRGAEELAERLGDEQTPAELKDMQLTHDRDSWHMLQAAWSPYLGIWEARAKLRRSLIEQVPDEVIERVAKEDMRDHRPAEDQRRFAARFLEDIAEGTAIQMGVHVQRSMEAFRTARRLERRAQEYRADGGRSVNHWGSATSHNNTARGCAVYGDHGYFRPIDRWEEPPLQLTPGAAPVRPDTGKDPGAPLSLEERMDGAAALMYAQRLAATLPREKFPTAWRGMMVREDSVHHIVQRIADGGHGRLAFTGCTAFAFRLSTAEHYSGSAWSQSTSAGAHGDAPKASVILHIDRTEDFDRSLGGWHLSFGAGRDAPEGAEPYEVISAARAMRVVRAEHDPATNKWHLYGEAVHD